MPPTKTMPQKKIITVRMNPALHEALAEHVERKRAQVAAERWAKLQAGEDPGPRQSISMNQQCIAAIVATILADWPGDDEELVDFSKWGLSGTPRKIRLSVEEYPEKDPPAESQPAAAAS